MVSLFRRCFARNLDLDRVDDQVLRGDSVHGLSGHDLWRLIRLLFAQAIGDRASAIHIFRDEDDGLFRMLYCLRKNGEDTWYEMTPPPATASAQIVQALRRKCRLSNARPQGRVFYIQDRRIKNASCMSTGPNELCVYFTDHRPRVLKKRAGDKPGVPLSKATGL